MDIMGAAARYLEMLVKSYNPAQHERLIEERGRVFVWFVSITFLIGTMLFVTTFLIGAFGFINRLPSTLDEVQQFQMSGTLEADHPVRIMEYPSVLIDLPQNVTESEHDVLITQQGIVYPTFLLIGESYATWEELRDLKNPTPTRDRLLVGLVLFILPSVVFWFLVYTLLKLFLIFLLLSLVGYWAPRAFSHVIKGRDVMKLALLSMPSVILIGVGLFPLAPQELFWWGLLLTAGVFLLGVALVSDRLATPKRRKE